MRAAFIIVGAALVVAGCGGDYTYGSTLAAPGGVAVSLSPQNPTIKPDGEIQFIANVTGNSNTAVTWTVTPPAGGVAPTGTSPTITTSGLFTAGTALGTYTVTAISVANDSIFARSSVTVAPTTSP